MMNLALTIATVTSTVVYDVYIQLLIVIACLAELVYEKPYYTVSQLK